MAMKRRSFVAALLAWPLAVLAKRGLTGRVYRAQYPGPCLPLDDARIRQPGKWAG